MDRKLDRKFWQKKKFPIGVIACLSLFFVGYLASKSGADHFVDEYSSVRIGEVIEGEFLEYVPIVGKIEPVKSVVVGVIQGGRVEEIYVEDGQAVKKGDPILQLSNDEFLQRSIENESRYITAIQQLRESRIELTQEKLIQEDELLDANYALLKLERQFERVEKARGSYVEAISKADYEDLKDQVEYRRKKSAVLAQKFEQDNRLREQQLRQIEEALTRSEKNLEMIRNAHNNLQVRADISGQLSTLTAEIGKNIPNGESIGQIDDLSSFKVTAEIDQFYLSKVSLNQVAEFTLDSTRYNLVVKKISPEVVDNTFIVEFAFSDNIPTGIRPGQSLQINLELSEKKVSVMLKKGQYYRDTAGRWIYKLADDGTYAYRQDITLGRQNPQYYEVLQGLKPGDRVIESGYKKYSEASTIQLSRKQQL